MAVSQAPEIDETEANEPTLVDHFSSPAGYRHPLLDKDEDKDRKKPDDIYRPANDDEDVLYLGSCGPGVSDKGKYIAIKHKRTEPPSQEQIKAAVERAIAKGWTHIYVYRGSSPFTSIDMQMAQYVQNAISSMGLDDKISCCLDEKETLAWLKGGEHAVEKYRRKMQRQAERQQGAAGPDQEIENADSRERGSAASAPFTDAANDSADEDDPDADIEDAANESEPSASARSAAQPVPAVA